MNPNETIVRRLWPTAPVTHYGPLQARIVEVLIPGDEKKLQFDAAHTASCRRAWHALHQLGMWGWYYRNLLACCLEEGVVIHPEEEPHVVAYQLLRIPTRVHQVALLRTVEEG